MQGVKCNKCGYVGDESEFPKGNDFFQNSYIARCPKCNNSQNPGDASMRMFGGERPFSYIRADFTKGADAVSITLHRANDAS
jgi:NAD-dependent SIR2 family protein deacetylase